MSQEEFYECLYCGCKKVSIIDGVCPQCRLMPIPPFKEEKEMSQELKPFDKEEVKAFLGDRFAECIRELVKSLP